MKNSLTKLKTLADAGMTMGLAFGAQAETATVTVAAVATRRVSHWLLAGGI